MTIVITEPGRAIVALPIILHPQYSQQFIKFFSPPIIRYVAPLTDATFSAPSTRPRAVGTR